LYELTVIIILGVFNIPIDSGVKKVGMPNKINHYLGISAKGVAILFVCFFAKPSAGSYFPFVVLSAGFVAYLFFSGIYSSASSIASDSKLRQTIRSSLLDKSNLLDTKRFWRYCPLGPFVSEKILNYIFDNPFWHISIVHFLKTEPH
jgi:hypothetical protein